MKFIKFFWGHGCNLLLLSFVLFACKSDVKNPISSATTTNSWMLGGFIKMDSVNPILLPSSTFRFYCPLGGDTVFWQERNVLNPAAIVKDGKIHLLFRAQDRDGTSRIGLGISSDGIHFDIRPEPVLFPDKDSMKSYEWNGLRNNAKSGDKMFDGVEDPRVVESEDGTYLMTYTAYDGKTARLCLAISSDLIHWKKQGLVLRNLKYKDYWSKSGAILVKQVNGRMVAVKVNGRYWMYFGDTDIFMASSEDLLHWEASENEENKQLISALQPRPGYFDSRLVEPGPFALLKNEGIMLIYNGSNAANYSDTSLLKFTYSAGQALFDKQLPYKLIDRSETYFIHPNKPYEKEGEVNEVCFVEGLVNFKQQWFLYYGTADSKIAVAICKSTNE